jgi:hypothetical protein
MAFTPPYTRDALLSSARLNFIWEWASYSSSPRWWRIGTTATEDNVGPPANGKGRRLWHRSRGLLNEVGRNFAGNSEPLPLPLQGKKWRVSDVSDTGSL